MFKLFGITVLMHWSWFLVAWWQVQNRSNDSHVPEWMRYYSPIWHVFEYVGLFTLVLLHEFGHSLACKQVGGKSEQIILWPLGGVAYVNPPNRPGAYLWSLAAGPLVNLVIGLLMWGGYVLLKDAAWFERWATHSAPDTFKWLRAIFFINGSLFVFNMMPVYPLDGGQILRSLLWYFCSAGKSLQIATGIGFIGVAALGVFAFKNESIWMGVVTFYLGVNCLGGWKQAQAMLNIEKMARRKEFACPSCGEAPISEAYCKCPECETVYDPFLNDTICPNCSVRPGNAPCIFAGMFQKSPLGRRIRTSRAGSLNRKERKEHRGFKQSI